jgi:hypothetical protein
VSIENNADCGQLRVKSYSLKITTLPLDVAASYSDHPKSECILAHELQTSLAPCC